MTPLDVALAYVERRGWPVYPRPNGRFIKNGHGWHDATTDLAQIRDWWGRWPDALIALPTGVMSGIVVLDFDQKGGKDGLADFSFLGLLLRDTPMALTPHDGLHCYYQLNPEFTIRTTVGELGKREKDQPSGLDVLSDGTSVALPTPGYRYRWHPEMHPERVLFRVAPEWLHVPPPQPVTRAKPVKASRGLSAYADAALAGACATIRTAPDGQQHVTLRREAFRIGTLAGAGGIPADFARRALIDAGESMTSHRPKEPWDASRWGKQTAAERVVNDCFEAGIRHPRPTANGSAK